MHVPDGFLDAPTSAATAAVAAAGVALALRGARRELDERTAPLAGLSAAFVFAVQMVNFPVGAGTSGHLMGGVLAAVLVGPWTAVLCMTVVLVVQALLFADGGLTALGVNVITMAFCTVALGYPLFRGLLRVFGGRRDVVPLAAAAAALVSVPGAALGFVLLFALGGTTDLSLGTVATAMVGVHSMIGVGEAAITGLTVASILAVRPDLVYGARDRLAPTVLRLRHAGSAERATDAR